MYPTKPLKVIDLAADSAHHGGARRLPARLIVIHATGGTDSRAWLSTTSWPPVSCHRLIGKAGELYKMVPDDVMAWTQGPARIGPWGRLASHNVNEIALSIELENLNDGKDEYPLHQVAVCAAQCFEWWGANGLIPIVGHEFIQANKTDPKGFPWLEFYQAMTDLMLGSSYRGIGCPW
jgi:N-acetyl-anhydromuramyl-L-alanine amidase AmpD